ncbi:hypothetical protein [Streptomyces sp. Rer75]|uniref:hypothetical protein n=1 Tax=Streptomyces sp. Rer75 TaxID=2750011 RepID=UPI0015D024A5|nr:hypothetical protein [Streptomyces sp. Rer75]QLH24475.1 hypothetical protein HYQ63_30730 [Streptomyces sp. Rer75]
MTTITGVRASGSCALSGGTVDAVHPRQHLELRLPLRLHRLLRRPVGRGEALQLVAGLFGLLAGGLLGGRVLVGRSGVPGGGQGGLGFGEGLAGLGDVFADGGGELAEAHDFEGEVVGPFAEGGAALAGPFDAGDVVAQVGADVEDLRARVAQGRAGGGQFVGVGAGQHGP